jgi:outer membrane protein OmpA-like peptidoglycan-associated protein
MRTSDFSDFDEALLESSKDRNWILVGLMVSLAIHGALCGYFYRTNFLPSRNLLEERVPAAMFKVTKVDMQALEKASQDQSNAAAKPDPDKTDVQLPDEKKSFDQLLEEVHASAALPDDTQDVLPDKPQVDQNANSVLKEIEASSAQTLSKSPNATREQNLLTDSSTSGRPQPAMTGTELATSTTIKKPNTFTNKIPGDSAGPNTRRAPGFSDLDSLLAQKGPLGSGTQMRMPDDQLFPYDSADLQPSAIVQLQKVGTLIKRNPKATFAVEGYTDSLGSAEYNLDLSERRAESVKRYLVEAMGINPAQINARGYGASKFIVAPRSVPYNTPEEQMEIERQRPNRRVVIVVHTDTR